MQDNHQWIAYKRQAKLWENKQNSEKFDSVSLNLQPV